MSACSVASISLFGMAGVVVRWLVFFGVGCTPPPPWFGRSAKRFFQSSATSAAKDDVLPPNETNAGLYHTRGVLSRYGTYAHVCSDICSITPCTEGENGDPGGRREGDSAEKGPSSCARSCWCQLAINHIRSVQQYRNACNRYVLCCTCSYRS